MADIETDVLIIGTGPAGSATAALLSSYGVTNIAVNRQRWLANTPRAHITNQRTMEVLRDLGPEVEAEAYMHATPQELMGQNVFCTSLAGEELGRLQAWGNDPMSKARHLMASPCMMNDLPQTFMEPILFKTACARGTQARMSTEYLSHVQDAGGVTTTCRDRLTGKDVTIRSKYMVGADGGRSLVAEHAGLPFEGKMGVAGSINIIFKCDLSQYVAHRPSVLYWVLQPGADVGGIGMGVVRMVRTWDEWLVIWGYDINQPAPEVDAAFATKVVRDLVGDHTIEPEITSISTWTVNNMYAREIARGRVFCMGDAIHRHPPSNGLGSNTSIQDAFNLAWKLAMVLKGEAGTGLLDSYQAERAPIAKQIVTRANKSIEEFGPIFQALGLLDTSDPAQMQANMDARLDETPHGAGRRAKLREAIAYKKHEFDCHGVEMNQRYVSSAAIMDGPVPAFAEDAELYAQFACQPGARLPHCWIWRGKQRLSTLDVTGKGRFTLLTGIGGAAWVRAAKAAAAGGLPVEAVTIGPKQDFEDHNGDWARLRAVADAGAVLVRPDHHVAWRADAVTTDPEGDLAAVFARILSREEH